MIGVVGQFLTPELVKEMPADLEPLAANVLEAAKSDPITPILFEHPDGWHSPIISRYLISQTAVSEQTSSFSMIANKVAHRMYGPDRTEVNRRLTKLSFAIIARRPAYYACWLLKAFRQCFLRIFDSPSFFGAVIVMVALYLWGQIRGTTDAKDPGLTGFRWRQFFVVSNVALLFFLFKSASLVLIVPPCIRYLDAAVFFMPLIPMAGLMLLGWPGKKKPSTFN